MHFSVLKFVKFVYLCIPIHSLFSSPLPKFLALKIQFCPLCDLKYYQPIQVFGIVKLELEMDWKLDSLVQQLWIKGMLLLLYSPLLNSL